jgi:hypothetical protein
MKIRTKILTLALLASTGLALVAQPAQAADAPVTAPAPTTHDLHCTGADCTLNIDLGGWQVPLLWRYGAPLIVENLQESGRLPAGATLTLTDDLTLALPIGDLQLLDANLQVKLDEAQAVESFRGTARVPFPAIGLFEHVTVADPLRADVGFDYGANLTAIDAPLDPDTRYFFFDFGSGVRLDGTVTDANGAAQAVSIASPAGQRAVLVIDPVRPLVYVQGQFTISHLGGLAFVDTALAANGLDVPGFDFASLPGRTSVGVTALLTDDPALAYLELSAGAAIDGGALAQWVGVDATPIAIDGVARIDHTGLSVTGATRSSLLPATAWDGRGQVHIFIPFEGGLDDAYVDAGGALSVPLAGVNAEGASRLILPHTVESSMAAANQPAVAAAAATAAESDDGAAPGLWAKTTTAAGEMAGRTGAGLAAAGDAVVQTGDAVGAGVGAAWGVTVETGAAWAANTANGAATVWNGATCALAFVPGLACAESSDEAAESVASR